MRQHVLATDVSVWHDTPWVVVKPYLGNDVKLEPPVLSAAVGDMVSVLTPDEMAACFTGRQFFLLIICYPCCSIKCIVVMLLMRRSS